MEIKNKNIRFSYWLKILYYAIELKKQKLYKYFKIGGNDLLFFARTCIIECVDVDFARFF